MIYYLRVYFIQVRTLKTSTYKKDTIVKKQEVKIGNRCSVGASIEIFGGKWKSIILFYLLMDGPIRFNELQRTVNGITQRMLTKQLKDLQAFGLVHREAYPEVPPRVEYSLTEKGKTLKPILISLRKWGDDHALEILKNMEDS